MKIILIVLLAFPALANGPKYGHKDPKLNDEFSNVYHDIDVSARRAKQGTATNNDAEPGQIGEYIESVVASNTNYPTSAQYGDLTSISLTAGDWDVSAYTQSRINTATWSVAGIGIGITSGNNAPFSDSSHYNEWADTATAVLGVSLFSHKRLSLSGTTTVYLKYLGFYSAGAPQAFGKIYARRAR